MSQNKGNVLSFSLLTVFFCSLASAACRLPMLSQPCSGQPPIWAFNSSAGLCVPYEVGNCQANANKFYTKAECEEYCGKPDTDGEKKKSGDVHISALSAHWKYFFFNLSNSEFLAAN